MQYWKIQARQLLQLSPIFGVKNNGKRGDFSHQKKQFLIEVLKDFYAEKALSKIKKTFLKYLY